MNNQNPLHLYWVQDSNNNWLALYNVDLDDIHFDDLYYRQGRTG